jgi:hypothetical protein
MYIIGILVSDDKKHSYFLSASAFLEKLELDFGIFFVNGHTEKMMIPHIQY